MLHLCQLGICSTADAVVNLVLATDNSHLKTLQTMYGCENVIETHDERLLLKGLSADGGYMHKTHCND